MSAATHRVSVSIDDEIALVTLDRASARNAVDLAMCSELQEAFQSLDADPDVGVILLRGAGPSFCAGADLKERKGKDEAWVRRRRVASFAAYRAIEACSKPVIGLLHGSVVGSGGEIAMSCDFVYAASDACFRFPEVHWGTVGATQRLQRVIGKRLAKELLFSNSTLSADQAMTHGLVQSVLPAEELLPAGRAVAARIASAPRLSVALTKRAMDLGRELTLEQGLQVEMNAIEQNLADGSWKAGVDRFLKDHRDGAAGAAQPGEGVTS